MFDYIPDNPYLLLTPGPLSTSKGVRNALLRDWCTWDADYNIEIVQDIRRRLVALATANINDYTAVLMQGSGSFSVEATLGSAVGQAGTILIISNGAYGKRMINMAEVLKIPHIAYEVPETEAPDLLYLEQLLDQNPQISHVALVHCETTTGILNPLERIASVVRAHGKIFILDAMSSFGGIVFDIDKLGVDFLISSSNKCIQGVPGFAFVIARVEAIQTCKDKSHSLCLDLYDQWLAMNKSGKWRYTSPTHVVRAFRQALDELDAEGGVQKRNERYSQNHAELVSGMAALGFKTLLPSSLQSPIITSFLYPNIDFDFGSFYYAVKKRGFVLYPGKISQADTFRIGNIGEVYPSDINRLISAIGEVL